MSSIFGIVQFHSKPVEPYTLHRMLQTLNHWHADDTGMWHENVAGLGHLMLYNTPESLSENLPLHHNLSGLTITADARIDNREELFSKLEIKFSERNTIADSVLILQAYRKYGQNCTKHLIGDFAFAIWDSHNQTLFCARDQMGVKPLFYYQDHNIFVFASEKKGILCLDQVNKEIDRQFLYNQMIWPLSQETDTTLYQHIRRVKPAHLLSLRADTGKLSQEQYWTLDVNRIITLPKKEDYYEGLRHHFEQAIQCRLRTAYPLGAELSGGMDSSAITGAANTLMKASGKTLTTFSNTIDDETLAKNIYIHNERKYTDAVIKFNNIDDYVYVTETCWDSPLQETDHYLTMNDGLERIEMLWLLPGKKIAMGKNIRTMLSGFAGDQMVTSLVNNYALDYLEKKQFIKYFRAPLKHSNTLDKFKTLLPDGISEQWFKFKNRIKWYDQSIRIASQFYNIPDQYKKVCNVIPRKDPLFKERRKGLRHAQRFGLLSPSVYQRLESENRYGLYYKMETRFPMADIRLTQFYLSMPNELKYEGNINRYVYRMAIKQYIPDTILQRDSKIGYNAPFMVEWRKRKKEEMIALLSHFPDSPLIKKDAIAAKIAHLESDHVDRPGINIEELLPLMMPNLHILRWIEKNPLLF